MLGRLRPALAGISGGLTFAIACGIWLVTTLGALLLARREWIVAVTTLTVAAPFVLVPAWRRRTSMFGLLVLSLAAFLLASESFIRLRYFGVDALKNPGRYQPIGAMEDPTYLERASEPDVPYTLNPGFDGWVKGARVTINSLGLRDSEWVPGRRTDKRRILTLGTSVTFGEGVPIEQTFSRQMARMLEIEGIPVEPLNFGVEGFVLGASQALLEVRGLAFYPDVVVQELSVAALRQSESRVEGLRRSFERTRAEPPRVSLFERHSFALYAIYPAISLRERLLRVTAADQPPDVRMAERPAYLDRALDRFAALAARFGFTGVLLVPRPMLSLGRTDLHATDRRRLQRMAHDRGLLYVDSYDRFNASDVVERLIIFPGDLHPNAEGHRRHAAALAAALAPVLRALHSAHGLAAVTR